MIKTDDECTRPTLMMREWTDDNDADDREVFNHNNNHNKTKLQSACDAEATHIITMMSGRDDAQ